MDYETLARASGSLGRREAPATQWRSSRLPTVRTLARVLGPPPSLIPGEPVPIRRDRGPGHGETAAGLREPRSSARCRPFGGVIAFTLIGAIGALVAGGASAIPA